MNELVEIKRTQLNIFNEDNQQAIILGNIDEVINNRKEQIDFYNNCMNCEDSADNHLDEKLKIKFIYVDKQEIKNDIDPATGSPKIINGKFTHSAPRMVFYTTDNKGIITFASGVYTSLKRIITVFGNPPYNDIALVFRQLVKGKSRILKLDVEELEEVKK